MKTCLHKALHFRKVTARELTTILTEVETVVNNRPLTYLDSDIYTGEALTPSHMLYGRKLKLYPNVVVEDFDCMISANVDVLLKYHNYISSIINKFVHLWETEYLQCLREKHYTVNNVDVRVPKINEVVIVKVRDDRKSWELGKITDVVKGHDGKIREVRVLHDNVIKRMTLDKLIPLEVGDDVHSVEDDPNLEVSDEPNREVSEDDLDQEVSVRPKRRAAQRADEQRKLLIDEDML